MLSSALCDKLRSPYVDSPFIPKFSLISVLFRPNLWPVFVTKFLLSEALKSELIFSFIAELLVFECYLVAMLLGLILFSTDLSVLRWSYVPCLTTSFMFLVCDDCLWFADLSWSKSYKVLVSFSVSFCGEVISGALNATGFFSPDYCRKVSVKILCWVTVFYVVISRGFIVLVAWTFVS